MSLNHFDVLLFRDTFHLEAGKFLEPFPKHNVGGARGDAADCNE